MAISLLLTFLLLALFSISSAEISRKELRSKGFEEEAALIQLGHPVDSKLIDPSRVVQLSWRPRVFLYEGFLSNEECDHLISMASGGEKKSLRNIGESGNRYTQRLLKSLEVPLITKLSHLDLSQRSHPR